jgi:hypothetical protein
VRDAWPELFDVTLASAAGPVPRGTTPVEFRVGENQTPFS